MIIESQPMQTATPVLILDVPTLSGRRNLIASQESEDAELTGMTRSLERRLLALNLYRGVRPRLKAGPEKVA